MTVFFPHPILEEGWSTDDGCRNSSIALSSWMRGLESQNSLCCYLRGISCSQSLLTSLPKSRTCIVPVLLCVHLPEISGCFSALPNATHPLPIAQKKSVSIASAPRKTWLKLDQQFSCHRWFSGKSRKGPHPLTVNMFPVNSVLHMWLLTELARHKLLLQK